MDTDEKGLQRRTNTQLNNSGEAQGGQKVTLSSIPKRFQRKDPKRPRFNPGLVTQVLEGKPDRSLRQVASALLKKDLKKGAVPGENQGEILFSVEEEEGRLAEVELPKIHSVRKADDPHTEKIETEPDDEERQESINITSVDAVEVEKRIEVMEEARADIMRSEEKGQRPDEKDTVLPEVQTDTQSEVCSFFTHSHPFPTYFVTDETVTDQKN